MTGNKNENPFVRIAVITGGIAVAIVTIIAIFSTENMVVAAWIVGCLSLMGTALGSMSLKDQNK